VRQSHKETNGVPVAYLRQLLESPTVSKQRASQADVMTRRPLTQRPLQARQVCVDDVLAANKPTNRAEKRKGRPGVHLYVLYTQGSPKRLEGHGTGVM